MYVHKYIYTYNCTRVAACICVGAMGARVMLHIYIYIYIYLYIYMYISLHARSFSDVKPGDNRVAAMRLCLGTLPAFNALFHPLSSPILRAFNAMKRQILVGKVLFSCVFSQYCFLFCLIYCVCLRIFSVVFRFQSYFILFCGYFLRILYYLCAFFLNLHSFRAYICTTFTILLIIYF